MSATSTATSSFVGATVSRADFAKVCTLLYDVAGIKLTDGKEGLVVSRLGKRIRQLGLPGFAAYLDLVGNDPNELRDMIDRLTTNKTSFFREAAHFDFLRTTALPAWGRRDLTIWSAGCSSGEEPYTIATVLYDYAQGDAVNARILATDLSHRVLARAKQGAYAPETMNDVPKATLNRHFERLTDADGDRFVARDHLREIVTFSKLNLMKEWPMRRTFDAIFCRNVMIYFDRATVERLVQRFSQLLAPDGYLFIGHSETLNALSHDLRYVAPAAYCKSKA